MMNLLAWHICVQVSHRANNETIDGKIANIEFLLTTTTTKQAIKDLVLIALPSLVSIRLIKIFASSCHFLYLWCG